MADTKFMSFAEVTPVGTDSVLVGNSTNGVRRAQLSNLKAAIGGIVEESFGENGYIKYANGLIIQWGEFAVSNQTVSKLSQEVTLPIAFTSPNYSLSVMQKYGDESDSEMIFRILDEQTSKFTVTMFAAGTHPYVLGTAKWIAIGY